MLDITFTGQIQFKFCELAKIFQRHCPLKKEKVKNLPRPVDCALKIVCEV